MEKTGVYEQDFAIIGIAARMPEAANIEQFWENLIKGRDSVRTLPLSRVKLHPAYSPLKEYHPCAYLEGIDEFDPVFFKVAPAMARFIDPNQRLMLEVVNDAIEDAGYCREQLAKRPVGVYLGSYLPEYFKYIQEEGMDTLIGNIPANFAGRIAYLNGFTGPAMTIDTACSSTLVALHMALLSLKNTDCEVAIVGGANIKIDLQEKNVDKLGVLSPQGKCRTFSDEADGVIGGEGVIAVLIKPLNLAWRDHDNIYALIKGSAVNQDGARSNGITAPSPDAQKEVIQLAWQNSKIDPKTISYIETHGTATKLGDPIEISGITKAFRDFTDEQQFCPIGTVKTNIGHLDSAAGLAGLLKTILSLKHKIIPPMINFIRPNPYIDFDHSPVYVNTAILNWEPNQGMPRRAGISSFGISGTNCHVILEEVKKVEEPPVNHPCLITLSGPNLTVMQKRVSELADFLKKNPANLANVSFTLNCGRHHYHEYRTAIIADSQEELVSMLMNKLPESPLRLREFSALFLLPDYEPGAECYLDDLCETNLVSLELITQCQTIINLKKHPIAAYFTYQYALAQLLINLGIKPQSTVGLGVGEIVSAVLSKRLTFEEGLKKVAAGQTKAEINSEKIQQFIQMQLNKGRNLFLNFLPESKVANLVSSAVLGYPEVRYYDAYNEPKARTFLSVLAALYCAGADLNFAAICRGRRISLPTYPYEKKSYWFDLHYTNIREAEAQIVQRPGFKIPEISVPLTKLAEILSVEKVEEILTAIWKARLGLEKIARDADFIELGGDSLRGTMLMHDIKKYFAVQLNIAYLLEYPTIATLSPIIFEKMKYGENALGAEKKNLNELSQEELNRLDEDYRSLLEGEQ